jgi:hypothetical protein
MFHSQASFKTDLYISQRSNTTQMSVLVNSSQGSDRLIIQIMRLICLRRKTSLPILAQSIAPGMWQQHVIE